MSSKYSNGPFGIGCAGSCGYATGYTGVGAPFAKIQKQFHPIQIPKVWTWNDIAGGGAYSSWTYLDVYTQMILNTGYFPNDSQNVAYIRATLQNKWAGPNDVTNEYTQAHPAQGWLNISGVPFIPQQGDYFWQWVAGKMIPGGNINVGPLPGFSVGTVGVGAPFAKIQKQFHPIQIPKVWTWNDIAGVGAYSSWTYLDVYTQMLFNFGLDNKYYSHIRTALFNLFTGPVDVTDKFNNSGTFCTSSNLLSNTLDLSGFPVIPSNQNRCFWYWVSMQIISYYGGADFWTPHPECVSGTYFNHLSGNCEKP